jgi:hypothetical protein
MSAYGTKRTLMMEENARRVGIDTGGLWPKPDISGFGLLARHSRTSMKQTSKKRAAVHLADPALTRAGSDRQSDSCNDIAV